MSVNEVKLKKASQALVIRGTGPPTSRTFCIGDEDHTLGNSLRHVLIRNSSVSFAGYSVPHPAEPVVQIRVQTVSSKPGVLEALTAADALREACQTLSDQCDIVLERLEALLPEVREDRLKMEQILLEEGYEDGNEEEDDE
jgi:DNA-directed RNA polymerases I and III subunit RPAC2